MKSVEIFLYDASGKSVLALVFTCTDVAGVAVTALGFSVRSFEKSGARSMWVCHVLHILAWCCRERKWRATVALLKQFPIVTVVLVLIFRVDFCYSRTSPFRVTRIMNVYIVALLSGLNVFLGLISYLTFMLFDGFHNITNIVSFMIQLVPWSLQLSWCDSCIIETQEHRIISSNCSQVHSRDVDVNQYQYHDPVLDNG